MILTKLFKMKTKKEALDMNNKYTVLIIKFVICLIAFGIGLDLFFAATMADILSFSVFVTLASYIIGDRFILPHFGQTVATGFDFVLTYASVWLFGNILLGGYLQIAWGSIISASILTVAEVFVHRYLINRISPPQGNESPETSFNRNLAYQTEFAEEPDMPKNEQSKK
jgi:hypothetical protein